MALRNAFTAAFASAEIHGCSFHLVQNLKKKLKDFNLLSRYRSDGDFALSARSLTALAVVSPVYLNDAVAELAVALPEELMPVLEYFEDTYVGFLLRIRADGSMIRREPLFPVPM